MACVKTRAIFSWEVRTVTLYNTALAKNPGSESGKFYAEAPDTPDEKIAQYALLFEHPDALTAAKEYTGSYWKYH